MFCLCIRRTRLTTTNTIRVAAPCVAPAARSTGSRITHSHLVQPKDGCVPLARKESANTLNLTRRIEPGKQNNHLTADACLGNLESPDAQLRRIGSHPKRRALRFHPEFGDVRPKCPNAHSCPVGLRCGRAHHLNLSGRPLKRRDALGNRRDVSTTMYPPGPAPSEKAAALGPLDGR